MSDNRKTDPANSTEMTDQQAATNDLNPGSGQGAQNEPGANAGNDHIRDNVKSDARGDLPDKTEANP